MMERWAESHFTKRPIMKVLILFICCMLMVALLFTYFIDSTCDKPTYPKIIQNYPRSTSSKTKLTGDGCSKWAVVTISSCSLPIYNLSSLLDIASLLDWCVVIVTPQNCKTHLHINQKQHIAIIDQGPDDAGGKHSGYIFAIEHGAQEIFDFDATQDLIIDAFLDAGNKDFIKITYPTGSVWNPYRDFLNKSDIWPRGFPQSYKGNVQEELSKYREMIPVNNVGVIQSLARNFPDLDGSHKNYPISGDGQENRMIALGLKTFVPFNGLSTLFKRSVFWGLFLPKTVGGEVSDIVRSFIMQKLMWKLGKNVAYSSPWVVNPRPYQQQHHIDESLYGETIRKLDELDLDCNSIPICLKEIYKNLIEWKIVHEEEMTSHTKWIESLMETNYTFPELLKPKPFVYLIMGQSKNSTPSKSSLSPGSVPVMSLKPNNVSDVFFVFWGDKTGDIFYPKSTYPQGRNCLLRHALAMEQPPGYKYFVFFDDDMVLSNKDEELFYWKKEMKASPIERFQEFLLKFKPNFAAPQYPRTALVPSKGPFTLSIVADSSMNAYSRDTIKFLNPIVESSLDHLSFYNHNLIKDFLLKVFYWRSSMHCNSVQGKNSRSENHFDTKKRAEGSIYVVDKGASSGTSPKETFEFLINNLEAGENNPLKKVVLRLRDITGFKTNWFKFSQDNVSMEIISSISPQNVDSYGLKFVPDLLKYFNKCQSIYKSRYIWQRSKIISNELRVTQENVPNC